jgi:cytochrome c55X
VKRSMPRSCKPNAPDLIPGLGGPREAARGSGSSPGHLGFVAALAFLLGAFPAFAGDLPPARAAELERLVRQDCGSCHGMTLKGGLGSDLRAETLAGATPETLAQIVLDGVPGTAMPPWRPLLTEGEALWIAEYLLDADK